MLHHKAFGLHRDEFLYAAQGQYLSLGYLENPPLIGILAFLSSLFGKGFFWVKLWPALFGAGTLLVTVAITRELGGRLFAQAVAGLGILFSAYLRIHFLFQPNFLDIFIWTLCAYFLICYINTRHTRYFYFLAIALAAGWWSKYSIFFFATALLIGLALTKHRAVFLKKHFWRASLLGFVLILPTLYWQYAYKWPLLHHMQELQATQLQYLNKADFMKEQLLMLLPVVFVWIGGFIWLAKHPAYRIIAFIYTAIIGLLMLGSGKGYYALGAYPMLISAGGVWLQNISRNKTWMRYAALAIILSLSLLLLPLLLPLHPPEEMARFNKKYKLGKLGLLRWEDRQEHPLQQDFADMIGWKELAEKSERFFKHLPDSVKQQTVVYCRSYGQAGALHFYAADPAFKRKIICDNGTFLLWIPSPLHFRHLLFVGRQMPDKEDEVFQHFSGVLVIDSVNNSLSRQYGDKIIFFKGADSLAAPLANRRLAEMKARFGH